jgi:hypothetical protein
MNHRILTYELMYKTNKCIISRKSSKNRCYSVVFCFLNPTLYFTTLFRREEVEGRKKKATVARFSESAGRPCELSIKLFWMSSGPD